MSKIPNAPVVTAFAPAHCESIIIPMLLIALQSISDAMYAPNCVWKNARAWCWFDRRRLRRDKIGSHEYRMKTARIVVREMAAKRTTACQRVQLPHTPFDARENDKSSNTLTETTLKLGFA